DGNLGGVDNADAKCQLAANAVPALRHGKFMAFISSSTVNPAARMPRDAPLGFVRVDGQKVANDVSDLLDGSLLVPINVSELGTTLGYAHAWTNTTYLGTPSDKGWSCNDWTSASAADKGVMGVGWVTTSYWSGHG